MAGDAQGSAGQPSSACSFESVEVTESEGSPSVPALVYAGGGFGIAWQESSPAPGEPGAWFALLSENGAVVSSTRVADTYNPPALVPTGDGFLLVMRDAGFHTARLDQNGGVDAKDTDPIEYFPHDQPLVVATPSGFLSSFRSCAGGTEGGTVAFDPEGKRLSSTRLFVHDGCYSPGPEPALVASEDRIGAAWLEPVEGFLQVHFAELSPSGELVSSPVRLTNASRTSRDVAIARSGDGYAVGWNENGDSETAHLVRVDPAGEPLGEELVWQGDLEAVVAMDSELGALFGEAPPGGIPVALKLHRFDLAGGYLGTELLSEDSGLPAFGHSTAWADGTLALAFTDYGSTERPVLFGRLACADFGQRSPTRPFPGLEHGPRDLEGVDPVEPCYDPLPAPDLPPLGPFPACNAPADLAGPSIDGDVLVKNPDDLALLAGTTAIFGSLTLDGRDGLPRIADLTALSALRYVAGDLVVFDTRAETLDGLASLEAIGGDFSVEQNGELEHLNGLSALRCIGGDLALDWNARLHDISGLAALEVIPGSLSLVRTAPSELTGLDNLKVVGESLLLQWNTGLTSLLPLGNLRAVGGTLAIWNSDSLRSSAGLERLERAGGLVIDHTVLENLDALAALTVIDGDVRIADNGALENVDGLRNVKEISGSVRVTYDPLLESFGLASLTGIGGDLAFESVESLTDLDALGALTRIGGSLSVRGFRDAGNFVSLAGLANLGRIGGDLDVSEAGPADACFAALECSGGLLYAAQNLNLACLTGLLRVGGTLDIAANPASTLEGLAALASVGSLRLHGTTELRSLAGLEALSRVSGLLDIRENAGLGELDGLSGLTRVGALSVENNPALPTCEAERLRDAIGTLVGDASIAGNDDAGSCR
jgi:hypothetical protein